MKKLGLMLAVAGLVTFSLSSCGREEKPAVEKNYTVQLAENQEYTFVLPKNLRNDPYEFTTQASHYSVSKLGTNTTGDPIYQYTPATNYVGTDVVVVNNNEEAEMGHPQCNHPGGPHPGGGQCMGNGGEEDHYIVTINFVVGRGSNSDVK